MHCLLVGNYGVGNVGDEALREYFLQAFPEIRWTVLSARPAAGELPRLPGGIRSFLRFDWFRTLRAMRRCDVIVFGGGSLFTDVESAYACVLWGLHALAARAFGKPTVFAFQGIGPFRTRAGEGITRFFLCRAHHVSVRDALSAGRIESWSKSIKFVLSSDPVFSLIENKKLIRNPKNVFIVIPRNNSKDTFVKRALELQKSHNFSETHLVTMQPDSQDEQSIVHDLFSRLPGPTVIRSARTVDDLLHELSDASFLLTQRYHGALAGLAMRVPMEILPQGEGDKLSTLVGADPEALSRSVRIGEDALRAALAAVR